VGRLRRYAFPLGALCLVLAALGWLAVDVRGRSDAMVYGFLVARGLFLLAGLVLLAAALVHYREALGRRSVRYGAGAALMLVLALGIAVLANTLALRHGPRWDLTENRRHSLSPQTVKILGSLRDPVEAIGFFRSDTPGRRTAQDLLTLYASYSGGTFTWRLEDPDRAPGLARRYGVEAYGTVVLERGGKEPRSEKILDAEEEKLTQALIKVTREGQRVIYLVQGHGEHDPANTERSGFSQAKERLTRANYTVKDLTLAREAAVPADAAVLILAGPRSDLLESETRALDAYLARGGKLLFMVNPFAPEGLSRYLARFGFSLGDDVVLELNPIGQIFGVGPQVPVITQYEPHPITREMGGLMTLFPVTRSVEPVKEAPRGVTVQALARTSRDSWGETDRDVFQKGTAAPDPKERKGPLAVAAVATVDPQSLGLQSGPAPGGGKAAGTTGGKAGDGAAAAGKAEGKGEAGVPAAGGDGERKAPRARIVVTGTSSFASNQFLGVQGNPDFFLNTVAWLAEDEDLLSVRPRDAKQHPIVLTGSQSQVVLWVPVVLLPGLVTVAGIVVAVRRRRAK
jgi:ABC-type uncharacterized transport system involved in gliding motility auxiliary subunit